MCVNIYQTRSPLDEIADRPCWISEQAQRRGGYPGWTPRYDVSTAMEKVYDAKAERWRVA